MSAMPAPLPHTGPAPRADDVSLARRIAGGDREAFVQLMRLHNRRLFRLARAALRDAAEAEDALQEAWLAAYRAMDRFRGEAALSTWLARMVLNECLKRLRKRARRQNVVPLFSADEVDMTASRDESRDPERDAQRAQMRSLIEHKLDELPASFRTVFVMRAVEELSVEETAACLGLPEATVRTRHFRARAMLRESLARELDLAERDVFDFGGAHCDAIVAGVLARLGG